MSKIFDNIVDVENYLGVPVAIPRDIPEGCNILVYSESTGETPCFYRDCGSSLYYIDTLIGETWKSSRTSLEKEVNWDKCYGFKLAYLRLATKDSSDVFTPERLLGVETDKGFVEGMASVDSNIYLITGSHIISASRCKFYISDDSDETVPFEDYVNKFYDGGVCGDK